jgi:5-methylcytosine-specific restriction endonuclease McrA
MEARACPVCGDTFTSPRASQRYCGRRCKKRATNHAQRVREGRDTKPLDAPIMGAFDCEQCGRRCVPGEDVAPHASRFCGQRCKAQWHHVHREGRPSRREHGIRALERAAVGVGPSATYYDRACPECGKRFVTRQPPRDDNGYCSHRCRIRQKHRRRRARSAGASVIALSFRAVALRDGWACGICGEAVDPDLTVPHLRAPTLDHVVPLARGGAHSAANAQLAHFICNARKRDLLAA